MKTNQELLDEANKIDFKIKADGALNARLYNKYERGLYFIKNALRVHGMDKYQYGLVLDHYVDNKTKVPVICSIHGSFFVLPGNHVNQKNKCLKCSIPTTENWIEKAKKPKRFMETYTTTVKRSTSTPKLRLKFTAKYMAYLSKPHLHILPAMAVLSAIKNALMQRLSG